jgi:hypothetical protein
MKMKEISALLVRILSQMNPVSNIVSYIFKIRFSIIPQLYFGLRNDVIPSSVSARILYIVFIPFMCATWPTHLVLRYLITLIILGNILLRNTVNKTGFLC